MVECKGGWCEDNLSIVTYELAVIESVLKESSDKWLKEIVIFSNCRPGVIQVRKMNKEWDRDPITNAMLFVMNR